ncbi:thiamine-phosphate kinase [Lichenicoccus sp.]|uniref:thiamine-phosphate kinase n=1 Tax=Lichenicoccus sp. TaxID=2781899 RepID=UPI003D098654
MTGADPLPAEFAFIARHFRPLAGPGALDLADDAAAFAPPHGRLLVVAADAMVQGVHFLADDPPETVGRKLLRVNLSDLAAMGAVPLGYLLTMARPRDLGEAWFAGLCDGLACDQDTFGVHLLGGDTTVFSGVSAAPLVLSLTIIGHAAPGAILRRRGAQAGDGLWVTGSIGDAALGLAVLQGRLADPSGVLADRYRLPQPRLAFGAGLHGIAAAAIDVSDGLVQDCGHLCRQSDVTATIEAEAVPRSAAALAAGPHWLETCLTGGDDYELLIAVPEVNNAALHALSARCGIAVTRIGGFAAGAPAVRVIDPSGAAIMLSRTGWSHL